MRAQTSRSLACTIELSTSSWTSTSMSTEPEDSSAEMNLPTRVSELMIEKWNYQYKLKTPFPLKSRYTDDVETRLLSTLICELDIKQLRRSGLLGTERLRIREETQDRQGLGGGSPNISPGATYLSKSSFDSKLHHIPFEIVLKADNQVISNLILRLLMIDNFTTTYLPRQSRIHLY